MFYLENLIILYNSFNTYYSDITKENKIEVIDFLSKPQRDAKWLTCVLGINVNVCTRGPICSCQCQHDPLSTIFIYESIHSCHSVSNKHSKVPWIIRVNPFWHSVERHIHKQNVIIIRLFKLLLRSANYSMRLIDWSHIFHHIHFSSDAHGTGLCYFIWKFLVLPQCTPQTWRRLYRSIIYASFPRDIREVRSPRSPRSPRSKARFRNAGYGAENKLSTRSRHFCTPQSRFRPRDPPWPRSVRTANFLWMCVQTKEEE